MNNTTSKSGQAKTLVADMNEAGLKEAVRSNLTENILGYWVRHAVDNKGGFAGLIDFNNTADPKANKRSILNSRILWTFSSAYLTLKSPEYLDLADRSYQYLLNNFNDTKHGGIFWDVDCYGMPVNKRKQVYAQSFNIYALAEYFKIRHDQKVLDWAIDTYHLLEKHSLDQLKGGYLEAFKEDWSELKDVRLSEKDMNEKKTMNTHLHILEAYTNLFRVWPSDELRASLRHLIEIFLKHFINNYNHLNLFFDENWNLKSNNISFGHDIECAWLLHEAAEVLYDEKLLGICSQKAVQMASVTLLEGVDKDGSIYNELNVANNHLDADRHWWPQAEGLVGFYNAWKLSGAEKFLHATYKLWDYIDRYVVEHETGEWHGRVDKNGKPYEDEKVGPWKCPYHNSRACLELINRIK